MELIVHSGPSRRTKDDCTVWEAEIVKESGAPPRITAVIVSDIILAILQDHLADERFKTAEYG